jgi:hypothetical protein
LEVEQAPKIRVEGAGAAEMVYRRTGDLRPRARARALRALGLMAEVGRKSPEFCVELDRHRCWNLVLPLLTETGQVALPPPSPPPSSGVITAGGGSPESPGAAAGTFEVPAQSLAAGALGVVHAAVRLNPAMAQLLLAVDGALGHVLEVLFDTSPGCRPNARKAAAGVLAELAGDLQFQKRLYFAVEGGPMRFAELVDAREPDAVVSCAALVLQHATRLDDACMDWMAEHPPAAQRVVEQWYQRAGTTQVRVTQLMAAVLANDAVAGALNAHCSEGQAERLTGDLHRFIAEAKARRTGGASLQAPEDPMAGANAAKAAESEGLDAQKLATYLLTLLPGSGGGEGGAVVDVCGGDGGLSIALAGALATADVHLYTAEWSRGTADHLMTQAQEAGRTNVSPALCDFETLSGVPQGDLGAAVVACLWARVEDPPQLLRSISEKLTTGGYLLLLERSPQELKDARDWAIRAGFAPFAAPDLFGSHGMEVLVLK